MIKRKLFNKKTVILILILAAAGYFLINHILVTQITIPESVTIEGTNPWWNNEYTYRKQIDLSGSNSQILELNHAQMVIDGKSNADGSDLKIVAQKDNTFSVISGQMTQPDAVSTKITFQKLGDSSLSYYLYYGNKNPEAENVLGTSTTTQATNASFEKEESPTMALVSPKKWELKETDTTALSFRITSKEMLDPDNEMYAVVNDDKDHKIRADYKDGIANVPTATIQLGTNKIYLVSLNNGHILRSNTVSFNFSLPLYVAWTIDWEGTIPDYKYLDQMENISDIFSAPMTQYFNPRIYINIRITDAQRKYVSDWLKKRYQLGDDIGMHMHMQSDAVEEAGVKAKYDAPTWDGGVNGYDTPSTAYSYDDYLKILNWGKTELKTQLKRFSDFDIPVLQGYRAGGWFANLDTLKATQDAGFIYDTSGRVSFQLGANKMSQAWTLQTTTQPYYISTTNQNLSSNPTMALKELPDNGADSYWSSDKDLIANFYMNYTPGDVLKEDKLVVFLSHPDWFYIDNPKLQALFSEINKYSNDYDLGPVKFVTMRDYLQKSEYMQSINK